MSATLWLDQKPMTQSQQFAPLLLGQFAKRGLLPSVITDEQSCSHFEFFAFESEFGKCLADEFETHFDDITNHCGGRRIVGAPVANG